MLKYRLMSVVCAMSAAALLTGCPGLRPDRFLFLFHNDSEDVVVTRLQFKGPGDDAFGPNALEQNLLAGESVDFLLEAPFRFQNENGVMYQVRVTYEGGLCEILGGCNDTGTFRNVHAGERTDWHWTPGSNPDRSIS